MPNSSEVNISDVKKTLYGNIPASTYYDDVKKRTEELTAPAKKQGIDTTSVQPTLSPNDFFLKVLDTLKNKK